MDRPGPPEHKHSLSPSTTPLQPVRSPPDEATSYPLAAQIPVKSFTLPTFPPEASHLRELTLTSDIPLPDYQPLVTTGSQYELPTPPQSITHLTLELFSLGFPGRNPHFLTDLAKALPNLKSITFFSCLIDGLTEHSRDDALAFFDPSLTPQLREIHVIDSFVRPHFWSTVTKAYSKHQATDPSSASDTGLKVIEVSYTYRGHESTDFLSQLHATELPLLLTPSSSPVGAGFGLVEVSPEEIPDPSTPTAQIEDADGHKLIDSKKREVASGILPFASDSRATTALKEHFSSMKDGSLSSLKVLNLSMWSLTTADLKSIFAKISSPSEKAEDKDTESGLVDLTISLLLTDSWLSSLTTLLSSPATKNTLTSLEIIGVPAHAVTEGEDWRSGTGMLDEKQGDKVEKLVEACGALVKVEMSILKARKAGSVSWVRTEEGKWVLQQ